MGARIRRDDEVVVISGKDRGKTGKVLRVDPEKQRVYVEGLNIVKRHQKPTPQRPNVEAGVVSSEGPDPHLQRHAARPQGQQADARGGHPRGWHAPPRRPSGPASSSTDRHGHDPDPARLKLRYAEEIRPALIERFGYTTPMQAPRIEKITLNMGVGEAKQDTRMLEAAREQLGDDRRPAAERPPRPQVDRAVQAARGMPVGLSVTLRRERAYEFLDRLMSVAIPRIRDFRGLNPRSFDGRGNYSMGVREQIIFPEIDYDAIDQVRGLDVTITTSAPTDEEAYALLEALGMPFSRENNPYASTDATQEA